MTKLVRTTGALSNEGGVRQVVLSLAVAELAGNMGVEDQAVSRVTLVSAVPDGDYTLDYTYLKPFHGRVRVQHGALMEQ